MITCTTPSWQKPLKHFIKTKKKHFLIRDKHDGNYIFAMCDKGLNLITHRKCLKMNKNNSRNLSPLLKYFQVFLNFVGGYTLSHIVKLIFFIAQS